MTATPTCPKCDQSIPANAPGGICPACLLNAGLVDNPSVSATEAHSGGSQIPTAEELGQQLPQLEILNFLGRGGMGAVYLARQPDLDRMVAVKILPSEIGGTPGFPERFSREAKALAKLSHQNIVTVFEFGRLDHQHFIVMEYVDGANLRQLIDASEVTADQALEIVRQICDALQYAHGQGVVHRDIKPENILMDKTGKVKIADFGLAKLIDADSVDGSLTGTQQVMGTLRYMAPEQTRATKGVDHRADIFSLGVIFYELLTGDLPIGRFQPPSKKVPLDARLDQVVFRALEHEPSDRYQQASDVNVDLAAIRESGHKVHPSPPRKRTVPQLQSDTPPTLSSKAVWGAAWFAVVLMAFAVLMFSILSVETVVGGGAPSGQMSRSIVGYILMFIVFGMVPLGLSGVVGTPLMGFISFQQIKRSNGSVYGLRLAVFDIVAVPILFMSMVLFVVFANTLGTGGTGALLILTAATLFWTLIVGGLIYWFALRYAKQALQRHDPVNFGMPSQAGVAQLTSTTGVDRTKLLILLVCVNIAVVILAVSFAPKTSSNYFFTYQNDFEYLYKTLYYKYPKALLISFASVVLSIGVYVFMELSQFSKMALRGPSNRATESKLSRLRIGLPFHFLAQESQNSTPNQFSSLKPSRLRGFAASRETSLLRS